MTLVSQTQSQAVSPLGQGASPGTSLPVRSVKADTRLVAHNSLILLVRHLGLWGLNGALLLET